MVGHLRNVALLLHEQRSSRHKNFRIGGYILKIQLQTVFYLGFSKRNITSVQAPILGKRILQADKSDNHAIYHISSQNWQLLQDGMCSQALGKASGKASYSVFPVRRRRQRTYALFYNAFLDMIFYPHILQQFRVSKTIPAPACLVALMIWHICYHVQTFEV